MKEWNDPLMCLIFMLLFGGVAVISLVFQQYGTSIFATGCFLYWGFLLRTILRIKKDKKEDK